MYKELKGVIEEHDEADTKRPRRWWSDRIKEALRMITG